MSPKAINQYHIRQHVILILQERLWIWLLLNISQLVWHTEMKTSVLIFASCMTEMNRWSFLLFIWVLKMARNHCHFAALSAQRHPKLGIHGKKLIKSTQSCKFPCILAAMTLLSTWSSIKTSHHIISYKTGFLLLNCACLTLTVLVTTIDAQWEGMGDVGSARYEPILLPPCPTIRVLSYSN